MKKIKPPPAEPSPTHVKSESPPGEVRNLPCADCVPGAVNRKYISAQRIQELGESIREVGVIQAIVVRPLPRFTLREPDLTRDQWVIVAADGREQESFPKDCENPARLCLQAVNPVAPYEIVVGECRWRACNLIGRASIPATVRELTDREVFKMRLIENNHRENPNALDEAAQMQAALDSGLFTDKAALAQEIGCKRSHVYGRLRLLALPEAVKQALHEEKIPASIAELLATVPGAKAQEKALKEILTGGEYDENEALPMSFRTARTYIEENFRAVLKDANFDLDDAELDAEAGPCTTCPKRSGNLDPDGPNPQLCADPACFQRKQDYAALAKLEKFREQGLETLAPSQSKNLFRWGGQLAFNTGYAKPSDSVPGDQKERTYAEVLKGSQAKPVIALDDEGEPQKLFELAAVEAVLEEKGIQPPRAQSSSYQPETPEAKAKRELDAKVAEEADRRVSTALAEACAKEPLTKAMEKAIWLVLHADADMAYAVEEVYDRRGLTAKDIAKLSVPELRGLVIELQAQDYPARMKEICALAKIDRKAIEKEVRALLKAANAPKEHVWRKSCLVTQTGKGGMHDTYRCEVCAATGKRYGLSPNITPDKKTPATCPGKPEEKKTKNWK